MTGLRERERDPRLPEAAGEPELNAPDEDEVRVLVGDHLAGELGAPRACGWEYARWKPGVSLTASYGVRWGDDEERVVVVKKYLDGKERDLASKWRVRDVVRAACAPLEPWATVPDLGLALWVYPADRMLGGLERLLDAHRFHRVLEESGVLADGLVRRRKTTFRTLRYKPERRAVVQVDLRLRDEARSRLRFAARVHPGDESARLLELRQTFEAAGGAGLAPATVALDRKGGFLLEQWVDVEAPDPDSFEHAPAAGEMLARLHGVHASGTEVASPGPASQDLDPLFAASSAGLRAPALPPLPPVRGTWIHGDFHPDQVARASAAGGWLLMDLDLLAHGDPHEDLASWIADALHESPSSPFDSAAEPLLEGYRRVAGDVVDLPRLAALTARALVDRAAASFRRLEKDADALARSGLARASELLAGGASA